VVNARVKKEIRGFNMYKYFEKYDLDVEFYQRKLKDRLPSVIVDAHRHLNLPEHVKNITPETIQGDWALECGLVMSYEDSMQYDQILFPDQKIVPIALPWPLYDADTVSNNNYIAGLINNHGICGLYTVRPEYDIESIEQAYILGGFSGFKPYPYMASSVKGADVSIFDFMPRAQFALANKLKAPVLMHLPRAGRMPDPDNVREIRSILNDYPNVKLVIAHFGRCFNHEVFMKALEVLGSDIHGLWFDTAAVINPKVYSLAFENLDPHKILFGTDFPIMLWHGKREWPNGTYINLCRENFSWNKHYYPDQENSYTFIVYEQLNNILDAINGDRNLLHSIFQENTTGVYGCNTQ
jgi:uncharacterized protein